MNAPLPLLVLALPFLLAGCIGIESTTSNSSQYHSTDIAPDEAVSIVLNRYSQCEKSAKPECIESSSESNEQGFERCLTQSLLKQFAKRNRFLEGPKLNILPAKELRRIVFPDKEFATSPRSPEAIIELLRDNELKQRVNAAHLRYLVILDAETTSGKVEPLVAAAGTFIGIGAGQDKKFTITAAIVDMRKGDQSGVATGIAEGGRGAVLVGILLPVIPLLSIGPTESQACEKLGEELGQKFFLTAGAVQAPY